MGVHRASHQGLTGIHRGAACPSSTRGTRGLTKRAAFRFGDGMSTEPASPLVISTPTAVVAAVPFLLGFTPSDSIVAIAVSDAGTVRLAMRADIPDRVDTDAWAPAVAASLLRAGIQDCRVILVAYEATGDPEGVLLAVDLLSAHIREAGHLIADRLWCARQRWRSFDCRDEECCPPAGRPLAPELAEQVFRALGSRRVAASREELESELECDNPALRAQVEQDLRGLRPLREKQRDIAVAHAADVLCGRATASADIAMMLMALRDLRVRDTVLWDLMQMPPQRWGSVVDTMAGLTRVAPDRFVAPLASLLAIMRWQHGDGTRACIAVDRALQHAPRYSLARLIAASLTSGMNPLVWRAGMDSLTRDRCRRPGGR